MLVILSGSKIRLWKNAFSDWLEMILTMWLVGIIWYDLCVVAGWRFWYDLCCDLGGMVWLRIVLGLARVAVGVIVWTNEHVGLGGVSTLFIYR